MPPVQKLYLGHLMRMVKDKYTYKIRC